MKPLAKIIVQRLEKQSTYIKEKFSTAEALTLKTMPLNVLLLSFERQLNMRACKHTLEVNRGLCERRNVC